MGSLLGVPAWLVFAALSLLGPGLGLQRLLCRTVDPALVVPLGTACAAGLYWLSVATGASWIFPTGVVLCLLPLLRRGLGPAAPGPALRGVLPPALALVMLLALTQYPWNRVGPEGDFLLDPLVPFDSAFHVGLTHELTTTYPPQVPGVSGFPIGYHLGTDLVRAAAQRWAGIDPWDSLSRLDVTLWALALMLLLRTLAHRLGGPPAAVALAPWTLLLTDFSFLFGARPQADWWADLLRGNLLLSLVYANPVIPGLALAIGALVALDRYQGGGGRGWLAVAAAQAAALPFFKVFLGAHLALGLGVALVLARPARRPSLAALALPAAAATLALAAGPGGETVRVALAPLDLVRVTRDSLGLAPLDGLPAAGWAALWLLASLGLRLFALPEALRALRGPSLGSVLGAMALAGWPLGLLLRVSSPEVLPGQKTVNDAAYLLEQSGPLLWVFAALAFARFAASPPRRIATLLAVIVLAVPSTAQYVLKKRATPPDRIPAPMVRAMAALRAVSRRGDVVLQRPGGRYPPAPVVLAGRRVPYERFTPYLTQFARREELQRRHETVYRFFRTGDRREALAIARGLGAGFLALYGPDRVRFDTAGLLEPIHEEPGARLYRILDAPAPTPAATPGPR